jgi:NAD(P)H dehydrogenase (quinone)
MILTCSTREWAAPMTVPRESDPVAVGTPTAALLKGNTMSIVITGASGHLGRLVVDQLLAAGAPPAQVVATGRDIDKLADLAQEGVTVRRADFANPSTLEDTFVGAGAVLLVSTTTVEERFDNARNAIDAAARAGVSKIVYTSIVNASTAQMALAEAHRRTEEYLRDSGCPFVILRNGWYLENYTDQLPMITRYHALLGSARDGLVCAASRGDYAAAAVAVLTQDGHLGATYELGGTPFTLTELAATISDVLGTHIGYQDMSVADYTSALTGAGLPSEMAAAVADADAGLARGELFTASDDLAKLIGRSATTAHEAVRNAASMAASR